MFTLIPNLPPYAVGVIATKKITKEDYTAVLNPALQKLVDADWKGINMLLVMKADMKDYTAGAWLEDVKVNVKYFLKWNKLAIVTDEETMEKITATFNVVVPGEAKAFAMSELEAAKEWVSEP